MLRATLTAARQYCHSRLASRLQSETVTGGTFNRIALLRAIGILLLLFAPGPSWSLDPDRRLTQYLHTAWRLQDGELSNPPTSLVQTRDGYLWLATAGGLLRFDGVRFTGWQPPTSSLRATPVHHLAADADGSLWIVPYNDPIEHWSHGSVTTIPGKFTLPIPSRRGGIWVLRQHIVPSPTFAFCHLGEERPRCLGEADGFPDGLYFSGSLAEGLSGDLWVGGRDSLIHWRPGSVNVYPFPELTARVGAGITSLALEPDGSVWFGSGLGLQHLVNGVATPFVAPGFDSSTLSVMALHLDRYDALWIGTFNQGLYRIYRNQVDRFTTAEGLSGDYIQDIEEDHEGSIWVVTAGGIDNFRNARVSSFSQQQGLQTAEPDVVLATRDGTVWVGGGGDGLDAIQGDHITRLTLPNYSGGVLGTALFEDHAGQLWIGVNQNLLRYSHGKFDRVLRRDGTPTGLVRDLAEDSAGNLWAMGRDPRGFLMRIRGLTVEEAIPGSVVPKARSIAIDREGSIWLGLYDGALARYRDGHLDRFQALSGPGNLELLQVTAAPDGSILAASDRGLIGWRNGRVRTMTVADGLPCDHIFTLVFDSQNGLWLYTPCGLLQMSSTTLESWWTQPRARVNVRVFDAVDGAYPAAAPFRSATRSPDGRLWFINQRMVQTIDPSHLDGNPLAPPVDIEGIIADRRSYVPSDGLRLPPLTRDVEIDFTALSFIAPAKVRFRYTLEGRDKAWRESALRQAFYTDLRPGRYRFRVIGSNNDGVWNTTGTSLSFTVAPAWYQTYWCWAICAAGIGFIAWLWSRWRLRRIASALATRFDERLAERTRLARELHDTLLQTIQGSKMVADDALDPSRAPAEVRQALARLSTWLAKAVEEGRRALNSLRTSTVETNDLGTALCRAAEECRGLAPIEVTCSVIGTTREMHPIVRDEIYRIGYEAIRNACAHSQGARLEVTLEYSEALQLRVSDDGVGIDPHIAERGRESHFGLQGMRERATRIGAQLTVLTSPDSGTEVTLIVPGRVVFRSAARSRFSRTKHLFSRTNYFG
jgi:signal transduction histidine kinase/ligand-binding sensor domain-containing protein